ncbi:MAG: efflux RND transporter periplasmic adaptor subunit [Candidatus Saccharimonas sp.]|nr:efflux RND transporter periplasmic adaptor subunit [Planctomycetaceae bacterium]
MASTEPSSSLTDRVQSLRLPPPGSGSSGSARLPWFLSVVLAGAVVYLLVMGSPWKPATPSAGDDTAATASAGTKPGAGEAGSDMATPSSANTNGSSTTAGEIVLESKGYIIPEQQILVSPQVSGRVIELNFEAGQRAEKGFVLAVLDSTEYQAEYERVNAQLESSQESLAEMREGSRPDEIKQSKADLAEAQTNLDQAEKDYQRAKDLFEKKIIQPQDFETTKSQHQALVQRVERLTATTQLMIDGPRRERKRMAEAQVRQVEAELRRAKWRLDNCIITMPINGTILKKNAELGNLVNSVAFNGSFSLCDVADLSKLEVELSIQERDIAKVFKGQVCKVRAEAYPKRIYEGVVSRLLPIADRAKGAVPVRVRLTVPADEEGVYLKPEMGATVQFYAAPPTDTVLKDPVLKDTVPKDAAVAPSDRPAAAAPATTIEQPVIPEATEPTEPK